MKYSIPAPFFILLDLALSSSDASTPPKPSIAVRVNNATQLLHIQFMKTYMLKALGFILVGIISASTTHTAAPTPMAFPYKNTKTHPTAMNP